MRREKGRRKNRSGRKGSRWQEENLLYIYSPSTVMNHIWPNTGVEATAWSHRQSWKHRKYRLLRYIVSVSVHEQNCRLVILMNTYRSLSTWMTSSTRVRGPCMPSVSCVHRACALHFFSRSFSQSSSQSSPTLLQPGGAFWRLLTASVSRLSFVELLVLVCGSMRRPVASRSEAIALGRQAAGCALALGPKGCLLYCWISKDRRTYVNTFTASRSFTAK